jgi:pantoate--beta-alanine ligase
MALMDTSTTRQDVHSRVTAWKSSGLRVGFVPTMGALHEGHLALVREALRATDRVVVSIFINPLQFGPAEDLAKYPRPIERDRELLASAGAHLLYLPPPSEIYPSGFETSLVQKSLPRHLCGLDRPGHFEGVLTVVLKLFNQVHPDISFFGQKDYQQTVVLRRMVRDLDLDLSLAFRVCPTVREKDGLALSSRNAYLSPSERAAAPVLKRALDLVSARFCAGDHDAASLLRDATQVLAPTPGLSLQYFTIADPDTLESRAPRVHPGDLVALAALLGRTRLIDNILLPK